MPLIRARFIHQLIGVSVRLSKNRNDKADLESKPLPNEILFYIIFIGSHSNFQ